MTTRRKQEQQSSNAAVNISLIDFIEMQDSKHNDIPKKMLNLSPHGKNPKLKSQITLDGEYEIPTINNITFDESYDKSSIDS